MCEMKKGGAFCVYGGEVRIGFWERDNLDDLGVDGRIALKEP
jgi:hypothetical protein